MNYSTAEKCSQMKAAVIHQDGRLKIRVTKQSNISPGGKATSGSQGLSGKQHSGEMRVHMAMARQPDTTIPGITKQMVRQHLPKLLHEHLLERKPKTASEWLLAEWHLARKFDFPRLRLAHLVSEVLHIPGGSQPHLQQAFFE